MDTIICQEIYQIRILTTIYSLSKQGKHLRKSRTASKSGPTSLRAKIFTVGIVVDKFVAIIFYKNKI